MARKAKSGRPKKTFRSGDVAATSNTTVKDLIPKDMDFVYLGSEPNFSDSQPSDESRKFALIKAYNWYSHFYTNKEAKEFLVRYLEDTKSAVNAKLISKVPDNKMLPTAGWMARTATRGLVLDQRQLEFINEAVTKLVDYAKSTIEEEETAAEDTSGNRMNIQEIMRERANEAAAEVEGMFDKFLIEGCTKNFDLDKKVIEEFKSRNILPQHLSSLTKRWERIRDEYEAVLAGKDDQINEGYASYSKSQMKNKLKFAEQVLAEINNYVSFKQSTKKVRVRKPVPVEKIVSKLKYCKSFKDDAQKLDLIGLHPSKLHGAAEAWVYDTKKRKMHHYVADGYSKVLSIKGNTVIGFDKNQSEIKTLRKPAEQLKQLTGSKPAARKFFGDIKSVAVCPKGRFSTDLIIMKAF